MSIAITDYPTSLLESSALRQYRSALGAIRSMGFSALAVVGFAVLLLGRPEFNRDMSYFGVIFAVIAFALVVLSFLVARTDLKIEAAAQETGGPGFLPPVFVTPLAEPRSGKPRTFLNIGLTAAEASQINYSYGPLNEVFGPLARTARNTALFALVGIGADIFFVAFHAAPLSLDAPIVFGDWCLNVAIAGALLWITASITCRKLTRKAAKRTLAAYADPFAAKLALIDSNSLMESRFTRLAEAISVKAKKANSVGISSALEEPFFEALNALAVYAKTPEPSPEMKRIADATHLHSDPAVKAVADKYAIQSDRKQVAYEIAAARKDAFSEVVDEASQVFEDRSLIAAAHSISLHEKKVTL